MDNERERSISWSEHQMTANLIRQQWYYALACVKPAWKD